MKKLFLKIIKSGLILGLVAIPLVMTVHGRPGNITEEDMNASGWIGGPFELSVERGRFALTYSVAENNSVHFTVPLARFATPDLGYANNNYVSLFAPGVSYLAVPGYLLGKLFGASQVGAFMTSSLFALINFFIIRSLCLLLKVSPKAAFLGALAFIFATPAFAYSTTLYQHHVSTFLILSGLYLVIRYSSLWSQAAVWALCAASILVDYPNLFLMFPIGLFAMAKFIKVQFHTSRAKLTIHGWKFLTLISAVIPLSLFLWFSQASYNNPFQFSGTVDSVREIGPDGLPAAAPSSIAPESNSDTFAAPLPEVRKKSAISFFNPRNLLNGLYIHILSPDRGILIYTPVMLVGLIGLFLVSSSHRTLSQLLISIVLINLVLYSLWGDPWGGWAFGSRYLIPAYALCSIGIGITIDRWRKSTLSLLVIQFLLIYSLFVNTLGAVTIIGVPPRIETSDLERLSGRRERFSFDRNWQYLLSDNSKSFVYHALAKYHIPAWEYYLLVLALPVLASSYTVFRIYRSHGH